MGVSNQSLNSIEIIGYLGGDVKVFEFDDGLKVVATVATSKGMNENKKTQWHTLIWTNMRAELAMNLKKGDRVYAKGAMEYRMWHDEKHNIERVSPEIRVEDFIILQGEYGTVTDRFKGGKSKNTTQDQPQAQTGGSYAKPKTEPPVTAPAAAEPKPPAAAPAGEPPKDMPY